MSRKCWENKSQVWEFLVVQWLRLHTSIARYGFNSQSGTKITQATQQSQKNCPGCELGWTIGGILMG